MHGWASLHELIEAFLRFLDRVAAAAYVSEEEVRAWYNVPWPEPARVGNLLWEGRGKNQKTDSRSLGAVAEDVRPLPAEGL